MRRTCRALLRLYPYDFRTAFERPMLAALDARNGELRELAGLAKGLAREWLAKITTDPVTRGRCLPDARMMRPPGITKTDWFAGV